MLTPHLARRAVIGLLGPVAALLVLTGCTVTATGLPVAATTTPARPVVSGGPCAYSSKSVPPTPQGRAFGLPADPSPTPNTGTVAVTLSTTQGAIPLTLDRAQAPCTVQSFLFLARRKFFDDTPCHRLTSDPTLKVLQCGDPTGTGEGGPGYTIPDENPKNLQAAQIGTPLQPGEVAPDIYPAGTIAMANTGQPNSGGSQFFLVYGDSELPPTYAIFGTVDATGMATLNTIAAGGITPGTDPQTGAPTVTDGKPKLPVTITSAAVSG